MADTKCTTKETIHRWLIRGKSSKGAFFFQHDLRRIMTCEEVCFVGGVLNRMAGKRAVVSEDGFFRCSVSYLEKSCFWTQAQQRDLIRKLKQRGYLTVQMRGIPAKRWFKIDVVQIEEDLDDAMKWAVDHPTEFPHPPRTEARKETPSEKARKERDVEARKKRKAELERTVARDQQCATVDSQQCATVQSRSAQPCAATIDNNHSSKNQKDKSQATAASGSGRAPLSSTPTPSLKSSERMPPEWYSAQGLPSDEVFHAQSATRGKKHAWRDEEVVADAEFEKGEAEHDIWVAAGRPSPPKEETARAEATQEPTRQEPDAPTRDAAARLYEALNKKNLLAPNTNPTKWKAEMAKLRAGTQGEGRFDRVLDWFCDHMGEPFVPDAASPTMFGKKFTAIEAAMARDKSAAVEQKAKQPLVRTPEGIHVEESLENLSWPGDFSERLPEVIERSLTFAKDLRRRLHWVRHNHEGTLEADLAYTITAYVVGDATAYVRLWLVRTNETAHAIGDDWNGVTPLHADHPRIRKDMIGQTGGYQSGPKLWRSLETLMATAPPQ